VWVKKQAQISTLVSKLQPTIEPVVGLFFSSQLNFIFTV